jgi:hypothetical protein
MQVNIAHGSGPLYQDACQGEMTDAKDLVCGSERDAVFIGENNWHLALRWAREKLLVLEGYGQESNPTKIMRPIDFCPSSPSRWIENVDRRCFRCHWG